MTLLGGEQVLWQRPWRPLCYGYKGIDNQIINRCRLDLMSPVRFERYMDRIANRIPNSSDSEEFNTAWPTRRRMAHSPVYLLAHST